MTRRTAVDLTPEGIRAAALEHNKDFPEARAEIETGEPVIRVGCRPVNNGHRVFVAIEPGINNTAGQFIGTTPDPQAFILTTRDGREHASWNARKVMRPRWHGIRNLPVEYVAWRELGGEQPGARIRDEYDAQGKPHRGQHAKELESLAADRAREANAAMHKQRTASQQARANRDRQRAARAQAQETASAT